MSVRGGTGFVFDTYNPSFRRGLPAVYKDKNLGFRLVWEFDD